MTKETQKNGGKDAAARHSRVLSEIQNAKIARLQEANQDLRKRVRNYERSVRRLHEEHEALRAELSALRASRDELRTELEELRAEHATSPVQPTMVGLRALIAAA